MTETIIGFDSAWADKVPGAICAITYSQGSLVDFKLPRLVQFKEAALVVEEAARASDFSLVAVDQPTLVPNPDSIRPVERVAGSIVNAIKGGVQPANRGKTSVFGDTAPIWQFLERIGARENPPAAREASNGLFLIEVFPGLALPSMVPAIWRRRRAAKYNPERATFSLDDWQLATSGVASFAGQLGVPPIAAAANEFALLKKPRKADQDKFDALICLTIALAWRYRPRDASMVIGDQASGYMVTPISSETRPILARAASRISVPVDDVWDDDARRTVIQRSLSTSESPENEPGEKITRLAAPKKTGKASASKICPECGHKFRGNGWDGIDAHWRAHHEEIMPYHLAWPIINEGGKPSAKGNGE